MKTFSVLLGCLMALPCLAANPTWTLVWSQEFNDPANTAPDPNIWNYDLGGGGWGNGELETYTNSTQNARMDGLGHLEIVALNPSVGTYTSARIHSNAKFSHQYGRVEASIQIPYGKGLWPAFWMLGTDIGTVGWPTCGENDIMENIGSNTPTSTDARTVVGSLHANRTGSPGVAWTVNGTNTLGSAYSGGFHLFATEWLQNGPISFYSDGTQYKSITQADVLSNNANNVWKFEHPFFIILNVAVGGTWPGSPDAGTVFPQKMLVDYVRVYKLTDTPSTPYTGTAIAIPGIVQAENFDLGGSGIAYNSMASSNLGGQYRTGENIGIEACTDSGGGYDVGWTKGGQWMQYTVNVSQSGTYDVSARVACNGGGGSFHLVVDGVTLGTSMTAPDTGGWQTWANVGITGINLTAGQHLLLLDMEAVGSSGSVANFNYLNFTLQSGTPTPSTTPSPTRSPTATFSPSTTPSPTRSPTATFSSSATGSPTHSPTGTLSSSATPGGSGTWTSTLTATPTRSATPSLSQSPTISSTLTGTPSATSTPSATPSSSQTPSATVSPSGTPSGTPATATRTTTPTNSATATGSPSPSPVLSPTATAAATPAGQGFRLLKALVAPNPSRGADLGLAFQLGSDARSAELRIYGKGMALIHQRLLGSVPGGWNRINLPDLSAANGLYYFVLKAMPKEGDASSQITGKFIILR